MLRPNPEGGAGQARARSACRLTLVLARQLGFLRRLQLSTEEAIRGAKEQGKSGAFFYRFDLVYVIGV